MTRQIPFTQDFSGRQVDIELLQSVSRPVIIERVTLSSVTQPAKIVAGVQKVVQRYANMLLSVLGDTHFDKAKGTELMRQILGGRIQSKGTLIGSFALSNIDVMQQLRLDDALTAVYGEQPDDERIVDARLLDANVDYNTQTIYLRVMISTLAGDKIVFTVPASSPR